MSLVQRFRANPKFLFGLVIALGLLLRLPAFLVPHTEGDEQIYILLAEQMGWDASHYTTADIPNAASLPSVVYVSPLFVHPPLFPFVLKLGIALGNPVLAGLLFEVAAMALLFLVLARRSPAIPFDAGPRLLLLGLAAVCPILLFSTSRLHLDGPAAIFFCCGVVLLIEAMDAGSTRLSAAAGGCLAAALNMKFSTLALLPLLPACLAYRHFLVPGARPAVKPFLVAMAVTGALGAPHYVRYVLTYGTLDYRQLLAPLPAYANYPFLLWVDSITRGRMAANLLAVYPFLPFLFAPGKLAERFRRGDWHPFMVGATGYVLLVLLLTSKSQMRYFAPFTPFAAIALAGAVQAASPARRRRWRVLSGLSLACMLGTALYTLSMPDLAVVNTWLGAIPAFRPYFWGG
jgi:hypothetical protein